MAINNPSVGISESVWVVVSRKRKLVTDKGDFRFDALLYATGRKPNIEPLHLENTDIALTERGGIQALGELVAQQFGLAVTFVDIDNPA